MWVVLPVEGEDILSACKPSRVRKVLGPVKFIIRLAWYSPPSRMVSTPGQGASSSTTNRELVITVSSPWINRSPEREHAVRYEDPAIENQVVTRLDKAAAAFAILSFSDQPSLI